LAEFSWDCPNQKRTGVVELYNPLGSGREWLSLFPLFCILSLVAEYYSGPRIHKRRGLCICNIPRFLLSITGAVLVGQS